MKPRSNLNAERSALTVLKSVYTERLLNIEERLKEIDTLNIIEQCRGFRSMMPCNNQDCKNKAKCPDFK